MTKYNTGLTLVDSVRDHIASLAESLPRHIKVMAHVEAVYVDGKWVAIEDIRYEERKAVPEEMRGGKLLVEEDWQQIYGLPELSEDQLQEYYLNQQALRWLQDLQSQLNKSNFVSISVRIALNRWFTAARLPYRVVTQSKAKKRPAYIGKLY